MVLALFLCEKEVFMPPYNIEQERRERALKYKKETGKTKYFRDDAGLEYWYSEKDLRRHYSCEEG